MKPFHYNQDPLYTAAASILTGQPLAEEIDVFESSEAKSATNKDKEYYVFFLSGNTEAVQYVSVGTDLNDAMEKLDLRGNSGSAKGDLLRKGYWYYTTDRADAKKIVDSLKKAHEKTLAALKEEAISPEAKTNFLKRNTVMLGGKPVMLSKATDQQLAKAKDEITARLKRLDKLKAKSAIDSAQLSLDMVNNEIESRKSIKEGDDDFYSQKMIKNQLQTIVRNSNTCLKMIEDGREFPEWAQSEIAVAEDGIVSVAEFMQSHHDDANKLQK